MYLISVYFDAHTQRTLHNLICKIEKATGNTFYSENNVPPHLTVLALETKSEDKLLEAVSKVAAQFSEGEVFWATVGAFLPQVIYVQPVQNRYLHELSEGLWEQISKIPDTIPNRYYQPFGWIPHCTVGKQLSKEQMLAAYTVLQQEFVPWKGKITKIGVAKTNPHRDLQIWELL